MTISKKLFHTMKSMLIVLKNCFNGERIQFSLDKFSKLRFITDPYKTQSMYGKVFEK